MRGIACRPAQQFCHRVSPPPHVAQPPAAHVQRDGVPQLQLALWAAAPPLSSQRCSKGQVHLQSRDGAWVVPGCHVARTESLLPQSEGLKWAGSGSRFRTLSRQPGAQPWGCSFGRHRMLGCLCAAAQTRGLCAQSLAVGTGCGGAMVARPCWQRLTSAHNQLRSVQQRNSHVSRRRVTAYLGTKGSASARRRRLQRGSSSHLPGQLRFCALCRSPNQFPR